jgi:hypothetical protein
LKKIGSIHTVKSGLNPDIMFVYTGSQYIGSVSSTAPGRFRAAYIPKSCHRGCLSDPGCGSPAGCCGLKIEVCQTMPLAMAWLEQMKDTVPEYVRPVPRATPDKLSIAETVDKAVSLIEATAIRKYSAPEATAPRAAPHNTTTHNRRRS